MSKVSRPTWRYRPKLLAAVLVWWLRVVASCYEKNLITKSELISPTKWLTNHSVESIGGNRNIPQSFSDFGLAPVMLADTRTLAIISSDQIANTSLREATSGTVRNRKETEPSPLINLEGELANRQTTDSNQVQQTSPTATRRRRSSAGDIYQSDTTAQTAASNPRAAHLMRRSTGSIGQPTGPNVIQALVGQRLSIPCSNMTDTTRAPQGASSGLRRVGQRFRVSSSQQTSGRFPTVNVANGQGISLIVWHKDNRLDSPIFTIDARGASTLREAKQQTGEDAEQQLKGRAHFEESTRLDSRGFGQVPALVIDEAAKQDAGVYTCTVEFHKAPTQAYQVQVVLMDPPHNMIIRDGGQLADGGTSGQALVVGPYDEDSSQTFTCEVDAGEPPGQVSWWQLDSAVALPLASTQSQAPSSKRRHNTSDKSSINDGYLTTLSLEPAVAAASSTLDDLTQSQRVGGANYLVAFHSSPTDPNSNPLDSLHGLSLPFADGQRLKHWTRINSTLTNLVTESGKLQSALQVTLTRGNLNDEYLCLASNTDDYLPLNSSIVISMNLKPTEVKIENKSEQMFKLGQKTIVQCQVIGSKPSAKIKWFRGTEELQLPRHNIDRDSLTTTHPDFISELSRDLNSWTTVSYLTFVPKLTDNQQPLTCTAQNPKLQNSASMSDSLVMNVQYPAILNLSLGANIRGDSIQVGTDVFMDCNVQANPPISDLIWMFNDKQLQARDLPEGIIMSNLSLVVQRVRIEHRGRYQCIAHSPMGKSASNKLELRPRFKPKCDTSKTRAKYELAVGQSTRIYCHVLAEPGDGLNFNWKFNQSHSSANWPHDSNQYHSIERLKQFETNFTTSSVIFSPETERHYGNLLCSASNTMGEQEAPCVIRIMPSELPDPVISCFFDNQTADSLSVHCQARAGQSGSRQSYLLELYTNSSDSDSTAATSTSKSTHLKQRQQHDDFMHDEGAGGADAAHEDDDGILTDESEIKNMQQVAKLSSDSPSFFVQDLKPATNYNFMIYVKNSKGRSSPASYQASTLSLNETSSGRLGFQARSEQVGYPIGERVKSFLKIGEFFGAESSKHPMIGVAVAVILGAISIVLVSFLLIRVCKPSTSSARRDFEQRKLKRSRGDSVAPMDDERMVVGQSHQLVSSSSNSTSTGKLNRSNNSNGGFPGNGSDTSRETNTDSTLISSPRVANSLTGHAHQREPQYQGHRDTQSCCSQLMAPRGAGNQLMVNRAITWQVGGSGQNEPQVAGFAGPTPSPVGVNANGTIYSSIRVNNRQLQEPSRNQTPQVSIQSGSEYTTSQNADDPSSEHQDQSQILYTPRNGQPIYVIGSGQSQAAGDCGADFGLGAEGGQQQQQPPPPLTFWAPCPEQGDAFDSGSLTHANRCRLVTGNDSATMQTIPQVNHILANSMSIPVSLSALQHADFQHHGHHYHPNQRRFSQDPQQQQHEFCLSSSDHLAAGSYLTLAPETLAMQQRCKQFQQQGCYYDEQDDPLLLAANLSPPENFATHTAYCASTLDDPRRMRRATNAAGANSTGNWKCFDHHQPETDLQQHNQQQKHHRVKFEHQDPQQSDGLEEQLSRLTQTSTETEATANSSHYL